MQRVTVVQAVPGDLLMKALKSAVAIMAEHLEPTSDALENIMTLRKLLLDTIAAKERIDNEEEEKRDNVRRMTVADAIEAGMPRRALRYAVASAKKLGISFGEAALLAYDRVETDLSRAGVDTDELRDELADASPEELDVLTAKIQRTLREIRK